MRTNEAGLDIIRKWEGLRLESYLCPAKIWTIGYGHTSAAGFPAVHKGMKITREDADAILARDLVKYEATVDRLVKKPLNKNQFSALVSFVYNVGEGNFAKSTLLKKVNAGDYAGAANEFQKWNKGGGKVLQGLVSRRADEKALFLKVESVPVKSKGIIEIILKIFGVKK